MPPSCMLVAASASMRSARSDNPIAAWNPALPPAALLLPTLALGLRPVALITQLTRSAMLDTLSQDYVRTAIAKGLPRRKVIFVHTLRNALNPLVSAISGWFAALLTGAFFVENVFNFKGLGDVTVHALLNFDIPVVLGCVLFTSGVFVVVNLVADLLFVWLDPRVRL